MVTRMIPLVCLPLVLWSAAPLAAQSETSQKHSEVWSVTGGVTVIHFNEDLMKTLGITLLTVEETASGPPPDKTNMEMPQVAFQIDPASTFEYSVMDSVFVSNGVQGGRILHKGGFTLAILGGDQKTVHRVEFKDFVIDYAPPADPAEKKKPDVNYLVLKTARPESPVYMNLIDGMSIFINTSRSADYGDAKATDQPYYIRNFLEPEPVLWIGHTDVQVSSAWAKQLGRPDLDGLSIALLEVNGISVNTGKEGPPAPRVNRDVNKPGKYPAPPAEGK